MDIKWKNIKYNKQIRNLAFIIAIVFFTSSFIIVEYLSENTSSGTWEPVSQEDYLESRALKHQLDRITSDLITMLKYYKNEDNIESGGTLEKESSNYYYSHKLRALYSQFKYEGNNPTMKKKDLIAQFEKEYAQEIKLYKDKEIQNHLNDYYKLMQKINSINGLHYYITDGVNSYSNTNNITKAFYRSLPVYIIFDEKDENASIERYTHRSYTNYKLDYYPHDVMYVALGDEFLSPKLEEWQNDRALLRLNMTIVLLLMIGVIVALLYLFYVAGMSINDDDINLSRIDRIYLELHLILIIFISVACFGISEFFEGFGYFAFIPSLLIVSALSINFLLSIVKHIKNKSIIRHTLIYKILNWIYRFYLKIVNGTPLILRMYPTPNRANNLRNIIKGVTQIKNGALDYTIPTNQKGIYGELAENINSITDGLKSAVNNELKSERLKAELISNVSHDIRTPLTSIITYIDLLKKEGCASANAEKYLEVIDQKAIRLKNLTNDLFEATKASTGNIKVNFDKVDIVSLLDQGMGELEDKISASGLDFRLNLSEDEIFILADGKLLWRVVENLMTNIFKYALSNSRVYIDVISSDEEVIILMKNISAYELNIDPDELTERFKRGDESRTSEGSGLGLSIAKSLVEIQNGNFNITIDGDLFKVMLTFPKIKIDSKN